MRAALISLPFSEDGTPPTVAGKTVCQRQLDFALSCDCELVVLYGRGATPEALVLRHQAESAGVRVQVVTNSHALVGVIGERDSLLVLQSGLMPQDRAALESLKTSDTMLVFAAEPGTRAGFERIDVHRAWAGGMTVPGSALAQLDRLPEDSDPAAALLRIALQQGLPERRLPDELLGTGDWQIVDNLRDALAMEEVWVRKVLEEGDAAGLDGLSGGFSKKLADIALQLIGGKVAGENRARFGSVLLFALLTIAALAATWSGSAVAGFLLVALSAPVAEFVIGLGRLGAAPFGRVRFSPYLRRVNDLALVLCGALAIGSLRIDEVFAPLVIGLGLLLLDRKPVHRLAKPLRDRGFVAILAGIGIAVLPASPAPTLAPTVALSLVALVILLAVTFAPNRKETG